MHVCVNMHQWTQKKKAADQRGLVLGKETWGNGRFAGWKRKKRCEKKGVRKKRKKRGGQVDFHIIYHVPNEDG
jgi:hypothetical protein